MPRFFNLHNPIIVSRLIELIVVHTYTGAADPENRGIARPKKYCIMLME